MLLLTVFMVACCCGCPAYIGKPMWDQYPASAAIPPRVADLNLRDDAPSRRTAQRLEREMRQAHLLAEETFAGVYQTTGGKQVTIFGTTGFRLNPDADLAGEITRLTPRYHLAEVQVIETDTRGRYQRCTVGRADGTDVVLCGWADHGSIGSALFTQLSIEDSLALLGAFRTQIVSRG